MVNKLQDAAWFAAPSEYRQTVQQNYAASKRLGEYDKCKTMEDLFGQHNLTNTTEKRPNPKFNFGQRVMIPEKVAKCTVDENLTFYYPAIDFEVTGIMYSNGIYYYEGCSLRGLIPEFMLKQYKEVK